LYGGQDVGSVERTETSTVPIQVPGAVTVYGPLAGTVAACTAVATVAAIVSPPKRCLPLNTVRTAVIGPSPSSIATLAE
jgi:hypothetical protein